jgi:hypothetical protein
MKMFTGLMPTAMKQWYWRKLEDRRLMREFHTNDLKYARELSYWDARWQAEGRRLGNEHYERIFLAMAGEKDQTFCTDKIVADFGCGPRGSLCWATKARARIGIDVLADQYCRRLGAAGHNMVYVCSSETTVPLPSNYVNVLFTLNALDHTYEFSRICNELIRILAPGGDLIGSFNLDEPPTPCEPQTLTLERVENHLLRHLCIITQRIAPRGPADDVYRFMNDPVSGENNSSTPRVLWVRARKA